MRRRLRRAIGVVAVLLASKAAFSEENPQNSGANYPPKEAAVDEQKAVVSEKKSFDQIEEHLLQAIVFLEGGLGYGFVYRDPRTIIVGGSNYYSDKTLKVTLSNQKKITAVVETFDVGKRMQSEALIFHLAADLPVRPLEPSTVEPTIGSKVYSLSRQWDERKPFELFETMIQGVSRTAFLIGGLPPWEDSNMPVVDDAGRIMGLCSRNGWAVRLEEILSHLESSPPDQSMKARPTVEVDKVVALDGTAALRFGAQIGGWTKDHGVAALFTTDLGINLWEHLRLLVRLGVAAETDTVLYSLKGVDGLGSGVVSGSPYSVHLGLEAKVGWVLDRQSHESLQFAAGVNFGWYLVSEQPTAFFSEDPGCDPRNQACAVTIRDSEDFVDQVEGFGWGPCFGLDYEKEWVALGYRFTPGAWSHNLLDTHMILFGLSY